MTSFGKGILDRIGDRLIQDQPERDRLGDIQVDLVDVEVEIDAAGVVKAADQIGDQLMDIGMHIDERAMLLLVKLLMNEGDGLHPFAAILDGMQSGRIIQEVRLGIEQADDDLQVVLDAMMDFFEQPFLFF